MFKTFFIGFRKNNISYPLSSASKLLSLQNILLKNHLQIKENQENMIRTLLKVGFVVVIGLVCYNYFFGTTTEKEQSKRIFNGVGNLFGEVRTLVRGEREKFDAGKYDAALNKMDNVIDRLKSHNATTGDRNIQAEITALEAKKQQLQQELARVEAMPDAPVTPKGGTSSRSPQTTSSKLEEAAKLARDMEALNNSLQNVVNKVASPEAQQPY